MRVSTLMVLLCADGADLAFLQGAQELRLEVERHLAHLVEEERAAVGELEEALLVFGRAREAALLVSEELALEEVLGHGRAVLRDEELVLAVGPVVHRARDELLARAGLALDEHRHARVDDLAQLLEEAPHRSGVADDRALPARLLALLEVAFSLRSRSSAIRRRW
jgi:hypothetical protein